MKYDPLIHHRRSIRLKGYDYAEAGMYFVTLTARDRVPLFGSIIGGIMHPSEAGLIIQKEWLRTPSIRPEVELDEFIIMPDHMHGIIVIVDERNGVTSSSNCVVGANSYSPQLTTPFRSPSRTLGAIIRGFKAASTKHIITLRGTPGIPVWQRNYYEHIVRDGRALDRIRSYIKNNVTAWIERQELEYESMSRDD